MDDTGTKRKAYFVYGNVRSELDNIPRDSKIYYRRADIELFLRLKSNRFTNIVAVSDKKSVSIKKDVYYSKIKDEPIYNPDEIEMVILRDKEALLKKLLGAIPKQKEIANYLGITSSSISGYPKDKKELMMYGYWVLKYLKGL